MSTDTTVSIAASCSYCGRENPEQLLTCTGCGTPLTDEMPLATGPKRKTMFMAVGLAVVFGPLGLLYSNASAGGFLIVVAVAKALFLRDMGTAAAWISFFGFRVVCVALAIHAINRLETESNPASNKEELLNHAARLESVDRAKAVAAYEEIIQRFPGTSASREAQRNIQILKQHT